MDESSKEHTILPSDEDETGDLATRFEQARIGVATEWKELSKKGTQVVAVGLAAPLVFLGACGADRPPPPTPAESGKSDVAASVETPDTQGPAYGVATATAEQTATSGPPPPEPPPTAEQQARRIVPSGELSPRESGWDQLTLDFPNVLLTGEDASVKEGEAVSYMLQLEGSQVDLISLDPAELFSGLLPESVPQQLRNQLPRFFLSPEPPGSSLSGEDMFHAFNDFRRQRDNEPVPLEALDPAAQDIIQGLKVVTAPGPDGSVYLTFTTLNSTEQGYDPAHVSIGLQRGNKNPVTVGGEVLDKDGSVVGEIFSQSFNTVD